MLKNKFGKNDLGLIFSLALAATLVVNLLMAFVSQIFGIGLDNYALNIVFTALNTLAIGSTAFICAAISKTNVITATKLNQKPPIAHIGWGCLATLFLITFMLPLNGWIIKLIVAMGLPVPSVNLNLDVASMVIFACVLPAFCEEIVFRGAIAGSLENNKNKLASLAIAGALFSIFHMNPAQTVHQFAIGALLALLYYRSGSIWTTVSVHLFNNIFVVILDAVFGEKADAFFANNAIWLFFVGLICFAGCVVGYFFTTKSKWQQEQTDEEEPKYSKNCLIMLLVAVAICAITWVLTLVMPMGDETEALAILQVIGK